MREHLLQYIKKRLTDKKVYQASVDESMRNTGRDSPSIFPILCIYQKMQKKSASGKNLRHFINKYTS